MADIFVDKILHNSEIKKGWESTTKELLKVYSFVELLNGLLKLAEKNNEEYYQKNNPFKEFKKNHTREVINENLKITKVADMYNLKPIGKKIRYCPFHEDKNPSLSLSNKKNVFNCFGCGKKGDIIEFIRLLEELKGGVKNGRKI